MGRSLGLPLKPRLSPDQLRRIYVTVIRQNWHLLPLEQIQALLGWTREKLEFTLKEDDFLDVKLGPKPACEPVLYAAPSAADQRRAAEIRRLIETFAGNDLAITGEPAFDFVARLSSRRFEPMRGLAASLPSGAIDLTGWRVRGEGAAQPVSARLAEYLRDAMAAGPASGSERTLSFHLADGGSAVKEGFTVEVQDDRIRVTGNNLNGLSQGSYWLQHQMESSGGPFCTRGTSSKRLHWIRVISTRTSPFTAIPCWNPTSIPFLKPTWKSWEKWVSTAFGCSPC